MFGYVRTVSAFNYVTPNDGSDQTIGLQKAIDYAGEGEIAVRVALDPGTYHLFSPQDPTKGNPGGLLIAGKKNLILEGEDSVLKIHGDMAAIRVFSSDDITLRGITIEYDSPSAVKFTAVAKGENTVDYRVREGDRFFIRRGHLFWKWEGDHTEAQAYHYDAVTGRLFSCADPLQSADKVEQLPDGLVRAKYESIPSFVAVGECYQVCGKVAADSAILVSQCHHVTVEDMVFHKLPGQGVRVQFCEDVTLSRLHSVVVEEEQKIAAGFGEAVSIDGCIGAVKVEDCDFCALAATALRVQNSRMRVCKTEPPNCVLIGGSPKLEAQPFFRGDEATFFNAEVVEKLLCAKVTDIAMRGDEFIVELDQPLEQAVQEGDLVYNNTRVSDVYIHNCRFSSILGNGITVLGGGCVEVDGCDFQAIQNSAVEASVEEERHTFAGWTEELTIGRCTIDKCGKAPIWCWPKFKFADVGSAQGLLRLYSNRIKMDQTQLLSVCSMRKVQIVCNEFLGRADQPMLNLQSCGEFDQFGNRFEQYDGALTLDGKWSPIKQR